MHVIKQSSLINYLTLFTCVVTTIFILPKNVDSFILPKLFLASLLTTIALFCIGTSKELREKIGINQFANKLICLLILQMILSSFVNKLTVQEMFIGGWARNLGISAYVAAFIIFLSMAIQKNSKIGTQVLVMITVTGIPISIYAWLQILNLDLLHESFPLFNPSMKIYSFFGMTNYFAMFISFVFLASLGNSINPVLSKRTRVCSLVTTINCLFLFPFTDMQGRVIYIIGGSVMCIYSITNGPSKFTKKSKKFISFIIAFVCLILLAFQNGIGIFSTISTGNFLTLKDRFYYWIIALRMIRDSPIFGVGIDYFGFREGQFRTSNFYEFRDQLSINTGYIDNAHNVFLQMAATTGIPSLFLFLILIGYICRCGLQVLKDADNKLVPVTLVTLWFSYLAVSLISIDQIANMSWGWLIGGTLVGLAKQKNDPINSLKSEDLHYSNKLKTFIVNRIVLIILLITACTSSVLVTQHFFQTNAISTKFYLFLTTKSGTDSMSIKSELVDQALRYNQSQLRINVAINLANRGLLDDALEIAEKTALDFPLEIRAWKLLAKIYLNSNNYSKYLDARAKVLELEPLSKEFNSAIG